jgi:serine/threonine-protein kinase
MIGKSIGNFRIVSQLGSGGMGEVFLAEQQNIDTKVAIKILRSDISRDQEHVQRFFNEARAVGRIKHAGIVKIFEGGFLPDTGHAYLIMEYLEGEALSSRIRRIGKMPPGAICDVGRQAASILNATHGVGITHRDLKPDNIFIVRDEEMASGERVKILDFGIAKLTGTMAAGPKTVGTMGTPAYMAPEQWGDSANVDWRADAYSLGCVLFEMACDRPPFKGSSFAELCASHLQSAPPSPASLGVELPPALEALIMRLLEKDAAKRTPAMGLLGRELENISKTVPSGYESTLQPGMATPVPRDKPLATTITEAAGERAPASNKKAGIAFAIGGLVLIGGVITVAVKMRDDVETTSPSPTIVAAVVPDAATIETAAVVTIDAAPAPTLRQQLETMNPFVLVRGVTIQKHQVTQAELQLYLAKFPGGARGQLIQASTGNVIGGMSMDRARSFCRALDADLPTTIEWESAAQGKWGIDTGDGPGPLQEWTSTIDNGLVAVRGGHSGMTPAERAEALAAPLSKSTEAIAGASNPKAIAHAKIGFRCVRR